MKRMQDQRRMDEDGKPGIHARLWWGVKEGSAVAASERWPIAADPAVIVESVVEKQLSRS